MQNKENVIECYNKTAVKYAEKFINELDNKHFDRIVLKAFSAENISKGHLIDLGCGPGQTTKFLFDNGFTDIIGADISISMIRVAKHINSHLNFEQADILNLKYQDNSFGSAIAFYSIVHFDYNQVRIALNEIKRVLVDKGEFLFAFHIGDNVVHLDNFLDHQVEIDFHFFEVEKIKTVLEEIGFEIVDIVVRQPYKDVEHQSERAYIWTKKVPLR
jgi:ubiquinone/menaquinone biosynthesis C-methylase UbiE